MWQLHLGLSRLTASLVLQLSYLVAGQWCVHRGSLARGCQDRHLGQNGSLEAHGHHHEHIGQAHGPELPEWSQASHICLLGTPGRARRYALDRCAFSVKHA